MNNLTSAFSLYEVLRIILPGFYTTVMLNNIFHKYLWHNPNYFNAADKWIIFFVVSVVIGGFLFSMDIPRWIKPWYTMLPSNLIEKNSAIPNPEDENDRFYEDEFLKFYYKLDTDIKFKTEIQSGFYCLFITMLFISFILAVVYYLLNMCNPLNSEYFVLNVAVSLICFISAIIIYKYKLRHSWKRNYELFLDSRKK